MYLVCCISHCNMEWIPAVQTGKMSQIHRSCIVCANYLYIIPHFIESFRWDRVFQEKGIFNSNCSEHMSVVIFNFAF
jgi:hypothetical protein